MGTIVWESLRSITTATTGPISMSRAMARQAFSIVTTRMEPSQMWLPTLVWPTTKTAANRPAWDQQWEITTATDGPTYSRQIFRTISLLSTETIRTEPLLPPFSMPGSASTRNTLAGAP